MTIDKAQLKALAEAATPGPWKKTVDGVMPEGRGFGIFGNFGATDGEENRAFIAAANPATVLELLAEIERLDLDNRSLRGSCHQLGIEHTGMKRALKTANRMQMEARAESDQLKAENEALRDASAVSAMRIKELDLVFGRYILAMRAAVIEDEHGKTDTTGMDWIFNSLAGPGQLPPEEETDAQAYFDREIVAVDNGMQEVMAFHDQRRASKGKEGRP